MKNALPYCILDEARKKIHEFSNDVPFKPTNITLACKITQRKSRKTKLLETIKMLR